MTSEPHRVLEAVAPGAGPVWAPVLAALALRPTFEPAPPGAEQALYATEFSWRFGPDGARDAGLRAAFALDPGRLPRAWVAALMRRVGPGFEAHGAGQRWLDRLLATRPAALQFGVDGTRRVKWYAYPPSGGSAGALCDALEFGHDDLLAVAFVALDLLADGGVSRKRYLAVPDRAAGVAALRRRGAEALAERLVALAPRVDGVPHALVLTDRLDDLGRCVDVTLHVRAEAVPDYAVPAPFQAVADQVAIACPGWGLRVTHHAWMSTGATTTYAVARSVAPGTGSASPRSSSPASTNRT